MKILKNWLKDYIDLKESNKEIAQILTMLGHEVEAVVEQGREDNKIIVSKIIAINPHPNADRLQIAVVTDGNKEYQIVCGDKNIKVGQIAPLALPGAALGGHKIEKAKLRGIESEGMLCAAEEIGIESSHKGVMSLGKKFELGSPFTVGVQEDVVFNMEITPNRGDCLSHIGIARELSAYLGKPFARSPISLKKDGEKTSDKIKVKIHDYSLCPQYLSRVILNVKVGTSPDWLKDRLQALGISPINNIVDITNYVMLDLGQPLHAFDLEKISGNEINVRKASREEIRGLDGVDRRLTNEILVIADKKKPVAIAGIIGGEESKVTEATTKVLLESAEFNPKTIRGAVKLLGLSTDASYRFERSIDSKGVDYAINKAADLIHSIAGGKVLSGIARDGIEIENKEIKIEYDNINRLAGLSLPISEINRYLGLLGFVVRDNNCIIPTWRHDIDTWQDLCEEVVRLHGFENIKRLPLGKQSPPVLSNYYYTEYIKDLLIDAGVSEIISYPYFSNMEISAFGLDKKKLLEISNPKQPEYSYLRNMLLPNLLSALSRNSQFEDVALFEIGKVFTKQKEVKHLAVVISGKNSLEKVKEIEKVFSEKLGLAKKELRIEEVSQKILDKFKVRKKTVIALEINTENVLLKLSKKLKNPKYISSSKKISYHAVSKFPSLTRDLAFIVDKSTSAKEVAENIESSSSLISRVELFDEFASDKFGLGKKNIAFHLYLEHPERTLRDSEGEAIIKTVINNIEKIFKAKLRDK